MIKLTKKKDQGSYQPFPYLMFHASIPQLICNCDLI